MSAADDLIRREDAIDRLTRLADLPVYEGPGRDALLDALDILTGLCSPSFQIPSAGPIESQHEAQR